MSIFVIQEVEGQSQKDNVPITILRAYGATISAPSMCWIVTLGHLTRDVPIFNPGKIHMHTLYTGHIQRLIREDVRSREGKASSNRLGGR